MDRTEAETLRDAMEYLKALPDPRAQELAERIRKLGAARAIEGMDQIDMIGFAMAQARLRG